MQRAHSLEKTLVLGKIEGKRRRGWQEMARVNIDILGISELKWTGMGEFNSDDHYICYCRQKSLRRNGIYIGFLSACNAGDLGSIPILEGSPGEGKDYPLQYSCPENSLNRGA